MDGDGRRNDSNQSAAPSSHSTYPAGRIEIILPFAPNNVELSMPPPSGRPSSDGPQGVIL
ncbi:hypothetical protein TIFTF001_002731 [Ficus carica]|uniref:Uncharacterized protein n=1 Tax=Ficus carica TaxID=3494 RepID=A0AA87Z6G2_FICCA|nr:hypothetical protein TIFTF001_002731 [Ficus carica]